jgi:hypothetical protein
VTGRSAGGAAPPDSFRSTRRSRAASALIVGGTTLLIWGIAAGSVLLFARGARAPTTRELVIPPGTAERVSDGANPLDIPPNLAFVAGDVLVVRNDDDVGHRVGSYLLAPGSTTRIGLEPASSGSFLCTIHPSGTLSIEVQPRGLDLGLTLIPTLALGPPLGLVVVLVRRVVGRLEVG